MQPESGKPSAQGLGGKASDPAQEILQRHFPELPERARPIERGEARRVLVGQYLDNVVATDRAIIAEVFHVLNGPHLLPTRVSQRSS